MRIEKQFEELLPPLTDEEFRQLEENILEDGIRDPLVVWKTPSGNEVLVDGHNRLKIAQKHNLKYETVYMTFDDFDDVKLWIYRNQIGRRNLKSFKDIETTIKLKPAIQAEAKRRQASHTTQGYLKSDKPVHTDKELGKLAHVGKSTIREVEYVLNNGSEETKELARSDKISIHDAYKRTVKENEPPKPDVPTIEEEHAAFVEKKKTAPVVTMEEIQDDKENQKIIALCLAIDIERVAEKFETLMMNHNSLKKIREDSQALEEDKKEHLITRLRNINRCVDGLIRAIGGN